MTNHCIGNPLDLVDEGDEWGSGGRCRCGERHRVGELFLLTVSNKHPKCSRRFELGMLKFECVPACVDSVGSLAIFPQELTVKCDIGPRFELEYEGALLDFDELFVQFSRREVEVEWDIHVRALAL